MTELQLETVLLAPDGPNILRARQWLDEGRSLLRDHPDGATGAE
jgi:hypothetical protein